MRRIESIAALEALYGAVSEPAKFKVAPRLTPLYAKWIARSRFCIVSTVGPEGTDASPRGDDGPVVEIADPSTLLLPDWLGNNRLDSLRNIVRDGRVSLMFFVPGSGNVIRVNGTAYLSADPALTARFEQREKHPRTVIVTQVREVYSQCAKAILRAGLWSGEDQSEGLPTIGELLKEQRADFDSDAYDLEWPDRAQQTLW